MSEAIHKKDGAAAVKTAAALLLTTYLAVVLFAVLQVAFFVTSGALGFKSTYSLYASGCTPSIDSAFRDLNDVSVIVAGSASKGEVAVVYTGPAFHSLSGVPDRIIEIQDEMRSYECGITQTTLEQDIVFGNSQFGVWMYLGWALISAWLILYLFRRQAKRDQSTGLKGIWVYPLLGVIGASLVSILASMFLARLIDQTDQSVIELLASRLSVLDIILLSVIVFPLAEEIVFRRVALQLWANRGWAVVGSVITSAIFAALHTAVADSVLLFAVIFVSVFGASLAYCWAYLRSGLLGSWLFHASYNATLVLPLLLMT